MLALRNRDFRLLWSGQSLSALADWFLVLAVPVHIYQQTDSITATGLMYAATNVPAAVVGPFAGVLVDRRDRRAVMAFADAARVLLLVTMAFGPTSVLVIGIVAERSIGQLYEPASAALVPNIVGTGAELTSANATFSASSAVVRLVGAPLGAALLAVLGLRAVLLLDAASFAISLAAVVALRWRSPPSTIRTEGHVRSELRDGFRHVRRTPAVRWVTTWMTAFLLCNGAVTGLPVPFVIDDLAGGPSGVGFVLSALGAGYLAGAAICSRITRERSGSDVIAAALAVIGTGVLALFLAPTLLTALPGAFVTGIGGSIALVTATTTLQRATPDELRRTRRRRSQCCATSGTSRRHHHRRRTPPIPHRMEPRRAPPRRSRQTRRTAKPARRLGPMSCPAAGSCCRRCPVTRPGGTSKLARTRALVR